MTLAARVKQEGAEDRARQCLDWFMHESAYQFLKVSKFKYTIAVVIKLQRAYRSIKFRRVVKRALMDQAWEKYVEKNKNIAQQAELQIKKKGAKRKTLQK